MFKKSIFTLFVILGFMACSDTPQKPSYQHDYSKSNAAHQELNNYTK